jgi:hypothetical protein
VSLAEQRLDVFVTIDRKLLNQIDAHAHALGFVAVRVVSNTLASYTPNFDRILDAAETVRKGEVVHVDARPRR